MDKTLVRLARWSAGMLCVSVVLFGKELLQNFKDRIHKRQRVHVALDWAPNTNHIGFFVAQQRGLYAAEGLDVTFVQPAKVTTSQIVSGGAAPFGVSFVNDVIQATSEGLDVVSIAAIAQHNTSCFAWRADLDIHTAKDFEGKRYGGWGSPEETAVLKFVMERAGGDFHKLKIVTSGISRFVETTPNNADFMWIYLGWDGVQAAIEHVALKSLCMDKISPVLDVYSPVVISSNAVIKADPQLARKFLNATNAGYVIAANDPVSAARDMLSQVPELDSALVHASSRYLAPEFIRGSRRWGVQKKSVWENYSQWLFEHGIVRSVRPSMSYFTNEYLPSHD